MACCEDDFCPEGTRDRAVLRGQPCASALPVPGGLVSSGGGGVGGCHRVRVHGKGGQVSRSTAPLGPLILPRANQIFLSSASYGLKPSFPLTESSGLLGAGSAGAGVHAA